MLIVLEILVIPLFLTLVAQHQQVGVGMSSLLSMLVETLILVGMYYIISGYKYLKTGSPTCTVSYKIAKSRTSGVVIIES